MHLIVHQSDRYPGEWSNAAGFRAPAADRPGRERSPPAVSGHRGWPPTNRLGPGGYDRQPAVDTLSVSVGRPLVRRR